MLAHKLLLCRVKLMPWRFLSVTSVCASCSWTSRGLILFCMSLGVSWMSWVFQFLSSSTLRALHQVMGGALRTSCFCRCVSICLHSGCWSQRGLGRSSSLRLQHTHTEDTKSELTLKIFLDLHSVVLWFHQFQEDLRT